MMKRFLLIVACISLQLAVMAQPKQDVRAMHTKIADLLAQQPAANKNALKANMEAMTAMGEEGILGMAAMLNAPGKGDNTALEYALGGYAFYVSQSGQEAARTKAAAAYGKALQQVTDKELKSFFLTQLQHIGDDANVAAVSSYLTDERLCDPAARTLIKINTPAAKTAIRNAVEKLNGRNKQILVQALGDAKFPEAASLLASLVKDADPMLSKAAIYAMAELPSDQELKEAAVKTGYAFDLKNATSSYITALMRSGGAAGLDELMKQVKDVQIRTAILYAQVQLKGKDAVPAVLDFVRKPGTDPELRDAGLKFIAPYISETSGQWIAALAKAKPADKASIIRTLGDHHATAAFPQISRDWKSKDTLIRFSVIPAMAQTGGKDAVPVLLNMMKNGDEQRIADALKTIKGDEVADASAAVLATMKPAAQAALIDIIARRKADKYFSNVLALTKSSNEAVRIAALGALKDLSGSEQLGTLSDMLANTENAADIKALQAAMVSASRDAAPVIAAIQKQDAAKQERYYPVLAGIGGDASLQVLTKAFESGTPAQKQAVVKALNNWKDMSASNALVNIARNNSENKNTALQAFVRLSKAAATPDQHLLMLKDAMELSPEPALKKTILQQTEQCKTFPALLFAGNYLDDAALQQEAAVAVMNITLADKSYNGPLVRNLLEKASKLLKGGDAEYQREAIRKYLSEMPKGEGFVSIFNGKDLSGWKGLVADPVKRSKMDAKKLQQEQAKADEIMRSGWKAENGLLIFTGKGDNLATTKQYGDFEMFVDWKITKDGDAGIYLRGTPQVQIWDTARRDVGAQVGSGGLYNNQQNPSKPLVVADNAIGEWNTFRIIMKGDRVTVYLNGVLVVNNVMLENYWDRKLPIFPTEQLELQAHGTYVAYRNLYVREFEQVKPFELSAQEKKDGYQVLFDGTNMHQFMGNTVSYIIEDGNLVCTPQKGSGGNLYTKEVYGDFIWRFEFQLTPGANNGLGIRAPLEGDAAYVGMELQILDNEADIYKKLHEYQYHGSVYGVIAAKRGFLKPLGEWNYQEVTVKGTRIKVELNGTVILDGDIAEARDKGTLDHKDHPGLKRDKGHIGFLGHGSVVRFRNIRIKDLSKK